MLFKASIDYRVINHKDNAELRPRLFSGILCLIDQTGNDGVPP